MRAFVFPGQGSQSIGMGVGFAEEYLDQASTVLGFDLKKICFEGSEEDLKKTEISQPAILTISYAAFQVLNKKGISADFVAGHSLGEYSAILASGAISFLDAVKLVHLRGKFMQEAVPLGVGGMAAILGLSKEKIEEALQKARSAGSVEIANFNSPDQIVISGTKEGVEVGGKFCKEAGAKRVIPLQVSAPFHCSMMQEAADKLKTELDKVEIKNGNIPIVANVNAKVEQSSLEIKENLYKQVTGSVLWVDCINRMIELGVTQFVEVGPGKVLAGLIGKINKEVEVVSWDSLK